jgi:CelD/BcsL family acetyltransferase involved in cellulose biosynthesis
MPFRLLLLWTHNKCANTTQKKKRKKKRKEKKKESGHYWLVITLKNSDKKTRESHFP